MAPARKRLPAGPVGGTVIDRALDQFVIEVTGDRLIQANRSNADGGRVTLRFSVDALLQLIPKVNQNGFIRVTVLGHTGSNGNKTTAASYVYTLQETESGKTISAGSPFTPIKPRPNGTATVATDGYGYYKSDGTFVLMEAYELYGTGGC